jgi:predicted DNA binding CopG/RHH family protein
MENRTVRTTIRFTEEERKMIEEKAKEQGMKMSEYIRRIILKYEN